MPPAPPITTSPGLTSAQAASRLAEYGPNELAAPLATPTWRRLLAQLQDTLVLVLLGAAVVSFAATGELKTPLIVASVVVINAVIGHLQEHRAERSLDALRQMLGGRARVRRDGRLLTVDVTDVVPGDLVLVDAGDRVPADGRVLLASHLEVDEATLTGETVPVATTRDDVIHMNTTVTRGRGEFEVTATGMRTEVGRIAGLLQSTPAERTPLQRQLDGLAHSLAKLAGVIVVAVVAIELVRGEPLGDVLMTAVALAVAAIPEGLPAVTAITLALGVAAMADRHAIVKRLASVETLGCTSVICTDKTGTLTLNEMTVVELVTQLQPHALSGMGYHPTGRIEPVAGDEPGVIDRALTALALCNDAEVRVDGANAHVVGDPTDGALVVLAMKAGLDVAGLRAWHPRLAELPFDSANKFMATVHHMDAGASERGVWLVAKGAPDVLLDRISHVIDASGAVAPLDAHLATVEAHLERLGSGGHRVLAVASRDLGAPEWGCVQDDGPESWVHGLTLLALVGIVDPPRPEARDAIAAARRAGIAVTMITGDHASTATAIGAELGLTGATMTGTELDAIDDIQLEQCIEDVAVFARVAPEHKMRLVAALQRRGHVVAMTGDGVNDAPALKKADIGIAMGITGTEVSKEAATMVLADDNFATIVDAVERGRTIYANIVKFVRFQLSTTLGFALVFLLAAVFGIAGGKPFSAIAILWVNIIMDGPPAMALGLDPVDARSMSDAPRPTDEPILTRTRWRAVATSAAVMAVGTLAVLHWSPTAVASTMAFNTFVLFQFLNILNARHDTRSVFHRGTLRNRWLWVALGAVVLLQVLVTHVGWMQGLFATVPLTAAGWLVCVVVASSVLWIEELRKLVARRTTESQTRRT